MELESERRRPTITEISIEMVKDKEQFCKQEPVEQVSWFWVVVVMVTVLVLLALQVVVVVVLIVAVVAALLLFTYLLYLCHIFI
jgi:Flp pilus assembly protein TadB